MFYSQPAYEVSLQFMVWQWIYLFSIGLCTCRLWFALLLNMEKKRDNTGRKSLLENRLGAWLILPAAIGFIAYHPVVFLIVHMAVFAFAPNTMSTVGAWIALIFGVLSWVGGVRLWFTCDR